MKIGIMGTRGIPNNYGGFEQFTEFIATGLQDRGYDVYVYSSRNHPYQQKEWNGVKLIHCKDPEPRLGTFGQFFYDLNCIRDARKRNFDVLFHFGYSSDSFWWRRWPKGTTHIMNMDGLEWKRNKYNAITRRFLKWAESIAARKPDRLIADSLAMQQHVLKTYGKKSAFIPYHATEFTDTDPTVVRKYNLEISNYCLVIARMEPENNIEMIIRGYIKSNTDLPLVLMGSIANKYGRRLVKKYARANIRFIGAIYDPHIVNNLRYYSSIYFHGHSVGGTNPSLLEAMACGCNIVSHDNEFNRGVLEEGGLYFSNEEELASIIQQPQNNAEIGRRRELNRSKIREVYNPVRILDAYEALLQAVLHQTAESNS